MILNWVWLGFILCAIAAALVQTLGGDAAALPRLMSALFDAARSGFEVSLGLVGVMALWLGLMRIGQQAGMIDAFARAVNPVMRQLFPGVPAGHPAQGAMTLNISANLLGLDNAATPLGLKAMQELQSLNPRPDTATNAQVMFLVLNTAGLTLIPTSVIAIRQTLAAEQSRPPTPGACPRWSPPPARCWRRCWRWRRCSASRCGAPACWGRWRASRRRRARWCGGCRGSRRSRPRNGWAWWARAPSWA